MSTSSIESATRGRVTFVRISGTIADDFDPNHLVAAARGKIAVVSLALTMLVEFTWAAAGWAISFYEKNGFDLLPDKDRLLQKYWAIPPRQIETSVVMGAEIAG